MATQHSGNTPASSEVQWIALDHGHGRVVARRTLTALAKIVESTASELPHAVTSGLHGPPVTVRLDEVPQLADIGSVAELQPRPGQRIGVARVGRSSFVAFARVKSSVSADGEELVELDVRVDEEAGTITLAGEGDPH